MPPRERYLFVCTNRRSEGNPKGSCAQKGSEELARLLKASLKEKGLAAQIRSCTSACLDLCEMGAVVLQEPEHVVYAAVSPQDIESIADAASRAEIVERLLAPAARRSSET